MASDVERSLVDTLRQSDLTNIAEDATEIALDQIVDEGLLQNIPVVSTLTRLIKTDVTIRDHQFAKKLLNFLSSLSDVPPEKRKEMIDRLEADPNYRQRVGDSIILLLERSKKMRLSKPSRLRGALIPGPTIAHRGDKYGR